jgi:hypothetical protein
MGCACDCLHTALEYAAVLYYDLTCFELRCTSCISAGAPLCDIPRPHRRIAAPPPNWPAAVRPPAALQTGHIAVCPPRHHCAPLAPGADAGIWLLQRPRQGGSSWRVALCRAPRPGQGLAAARAVHHRLAPGLYRRRQRHPPRRPRPRACAGAPPFSRSRARAGARLFFELSHGSLYEVSPSATPAVCACAAGGCARNRPASASAALSRTSSRRADAMTQSSFSTGACRRGLQSWRCCCRCFSRAAGPPWRDDAWCRCRHAGYH